MKLKAPETVFSSAGFCPGCGHGLATRLIGEVSEELGIQEKMLAVVDVACCSFNIDYWRYDTIMAAHGRDIPTAVGVKHIRPANPVFAYLGDGAAYSIGMAETIHAALRNDNPAAPEDRHLPEGQGSRPLRYAQRRRRARQDGHCLSGTR